MWEVLSHHSRAAGSTKASVLGAGVSRARGQAGAGCCHGVRAPAQLVVLWRASSGSSQRRRRWFQPTILPPSNLKSRELQREIY